MTLEEMQFWLNILQSPAIVAIASGISGSLVTLIITFLKFHYDSKENEKSWNRQEISRKELRLFNLKIKAYEDFSNFFVRICSNNINDIKRLLSICIRISNYGAFDVKVANSNFIKLLVREIKVDSEQEFLEKLKEFGNKLHEEIIKDIINYSK